MEGVGKWLIVGGIALVLLGLLAQAGLLAWLGRLPGDIRVERPGFTFHFPITTMVVVSVILSIVMQLVRKFFQ
jgi:membrane protein implicated in regulation of membrane protease activity